MNSSSVEVRMPVTDPPAGGRPPDELPDPPGRVLLLSHLQHPKFVSGTTRGWWSVHEERWPILLVRLSLPDGDLGLRMDLSDYPTVAPAARPWDLPADAALPVERWPTGPRTSTVLRPDWSPGQQDALYLPFDRTARTGHDAWDDQHPDHVWHPGRTVRDYLLLVREVLADATWPGPS